MNVQRTVSIDDPAGESGVLLVVHDFVASWTKVMNLDRFDLDARRVARP